MSFIDYNFFPILFFLGWNILTTKQFRPTIYNTSSIKTSPTLSVFSLTNLINQEILQTDLKSEKRNDILQFVPGYQFLNENQKSNAISQANWVTFKKEADSYSLNKSRLRPTFHSKHPSLINEGRDRVFDIPKTQVLSHRVEPKNTETSVFKTLNREADNIKYILKVANEFNLVLPNKKRRIEFSNHNVVNNNWKINFKSNFFDFTYRSKRGFIFSSFFPYNYKKIKPLSIRIKSLLKSTSVSKNLSVNTDTLLVSRLKTDELTQKGLTKNNIFFEGLGYFKNHTSFWKKIVGSRSNRVFGIQKHDRISFLSQKEKACETVSKKQLRYPWFFNKVFYPQTTFFTVKIHTKKVNTMNFIQKRRSKIRLLLRTPIQKIYSLNKFQIALCFSKVLQPSIVFNNSSPFNLASSSLNTFENENASMFENFRRLGSKEIQRYSNTDVSKVYDSYKSNKIKDEFKSPSRISETPFLDNVFAKEFHPMTESEVKRQTEPNPFTVSSRIPNQQTSYIDNSKKRKKNWYMKTQFFQHVTWNMKHKISDHFSDLAKENLIIYGGSWYYENLAFPYSIVNTLPLAYSSILQSELAGPLARLRLPRSDFVCRSTPGPAKGWDPTLNCWQKVFFKQKDMTKNEKLLESKRFALTWLYARQSNLLQNFRYWPYKNKFKLNPMALQTRHLHNIQASPVVSLVSGFRGETQSQKNLSLSAKLKTRLESDIGIYSLAHKLSSIGFRNGNSEIDIYPFKYNDSYRYNFQNMNISNYHLESFLGFSNFNNQNKDASVLSQENTKTGKGTYFTDSLRRFTGQGSLGWNPNFRKFLDFQNPTFSKIYAPLFQPQGLDLLSFLYNSFLQIIPNSGSAWRGPAGKAKRWDLVRNTQSNAFFGSSRKNREAINVASLNEMQLIINKYPDYLKNSKKFDRSLNTTPIINESSRLKTFDSIHHKLPINGIHTNPYPWITQNASDRWSKSNDLFTKKKLIPTIHFNDRDKALFSLSPINWETELLKNSNSQLHFTQKPSYIKKPSIFFSSFRHLPYFFISETPSTQIGMFPQANLSLFPLFGSSSITEHIAQNWNTKNTGASFALGRLINETAKYKDKQKMPRLKSQAEPKSLNGPLQNLNTNDQTSNNLSFPYNTLFDNNTSKQIGSYPMAELGSKRQAESEKKRVIEPWKGYLQHKSFNLKPLSTFIKKEIGYQTSLFSVGFHPITKLGVKPQVELNPPTNISLSKPRLWFYSKFSLFQKKQDVRKDGAKSNRNAFLVPNILKTNQTDLVPVQKNTWKIFPPLFQPLTFRFIDLNLPRTWSSKLLTSGSVCGFTPSKAKGWDSKLKVRPENKDIIGPQMTKWNMTQKNFFRFPIPFYFSDFFRFSVNGNNQNENTKLYESTFSLGPSNELDDQKTDFFNSNESKQQWNNNQKLKKKNGRLLFNETPKFQNSKIIVYGEKPLLKNRTAHGPPLKNQKESISLPSYLKNITNQNYQNLCPNNLNEFYFVFWILFNKTLFIYLSLHYLRKFISFLGTEYIRNLFKIFVTMKFIDGNILSIIKTFQDFNFQLNQQNVIDIKVNKQLKNIKRN